MMPLKKVWPLLLLLLVALLALDFPGARSISAGLEDGTATGGAAASDEGGRPTRAARGTRASATAEPGNDGGQSVDSVPDVVQGMPRGSEDNLLLNPDFADGFNGWNSINSHWLIHPTNCDSDIWPPDMAEMDQDRTPSGVRGWRVGDEDWLWQDVSVPWAHDQLTLTIYESHHMREGIAETRIYGSDDGDNWTVLWHRAQPEEEAYGAGKGCEPVPGYVYEIPLSRSYQFYRLEFHGKMVVENDGWIFSWLSLAANGSGPDPDPDPTSAPAPTPDPGPGFEFSTFLPAIQNKASKVTNVAAPTSRAVRRR
jgi:hypothetical protein